MKKTWWKEAVVYQIYPRSFQDSNGDGIGDIPGITSRLPYLRELGVDVIWLSPFYRSPGGDNGYDISDYQDVQPEFGTLADFDVMLSRAHELGLKVVIDLVVNHTSEEHPWFRESRKSRDNPYRDYYIWRDGVNGGPPNNWGSVFSGSAWKLDETTGQYYLHTFGEFQPDLNWDNPAVRQEVFKMMRWWCDRGVDGFRMDVISMISKTPEMPDGPKGEGDRYGSFAPYVINGPWVHEFLREMNREVLSKYDLLTVGECSGLTVEQACRYANADGSELTMAFQFEHMDLDGGESFKWNLRKMDLVELKENLSKWQYALADKAWNSLYWCNHDQPRIVSRLGDDSSFELRERSAKALALCIHMMQGTPYVYEGEELGMTNGDFTTLEDFRDIESLNAFRELTEGGVMEPEEMLRCLQYKSRDNSRTPMQWTAGENAGFTTGTPWIRVNANHTEINAEEQLARPDSVFHFYQKLIALRHSHEIIVYGAYQLLWPEDKQLFAYTRHWDGQTLLVVCNFTGEEACATLPNSFAGREPLISNMPDTKVEQSMTLHPWEAFAVLTDN
ncbi:MAG: alpha-glucosidase [Oscillibacter sp.]|nr:alpha-glucosidase [Oscillibacter sp.]